MNVIKLLKVSGPLIFPQIQYGATPIKTFSLWDRSLLMSTSQIDGYPNIHKLDTKLTTKLSVYLIWGLRKVKVQIPT